MPQPLLIEHDDGLDRVTLNRPDSLNALDPGLIEALNDYFGQLQRNRDTRVVLLKGAGKAFCAGLDLMAAMARRAGQQEPPGVTESLDSQRRIADIVMLMRRCPQPIVSLIHGAAAGGGFALALASDIRIAAKSARMNCAFIKLGLGGCDIGISYTLPRAIGSSRAFDLILTARTVDAQEALDMGIVSALADDPVAHALELAERICGYSPFGVVMTKEVMWSNLDAVSIEQAIHLENRTQILASTGGEVAEAATAFMEKRAPDWSRVQPSGVWAR